MAGIAIMGLNGAGKSTVAHKLAKQLDYYELDVEDCYFPEQRESRAWSLDHKTSIKTTHLGSLPFSEPRSKEEVMNFITKKVNEYPNFIMSGVTMNWSQEIINKIEIAFQIDVPLEIRVSRIIKREHQRFGKRVLEGGDMYNQQLAFKQYVESRGIETVHGSAKKLNCPVIKIDGTLPPEEILELIISKLDAR